MEAWGGRRSGRLVVWRVLVAQAELLAHQTLLALHHAAPVEAAEAVLLEDHRLLTVAALAAEQVAAAHVHGRAVAHAAYKSLQNT